MDTGRTTLNKMRREDGDKYILRLTSWFRTNRDYVKWNTHVNIKVKDVIPLMENDIESTGYYLTWTVKFKEK